MKNKNFVILAIVTVVIVISAVTAINMRDESVANQVQGKVFIPGLSSKINNVSLVEVSNGKEKTSLKQGSSDWGVVEKDNYPANVTKIKELILGLSDLKTVEPKTTKADNYSKLGVEDPGKGASSTLVTLKDKDGKNITEVIIGKTSFSGVKQGLYVRKPSDNQSWLVSGKVSSTADPTTWVDSKILNINKSRIKSIQFKQPDGASLTVDKENKTATDYAVEKLPKGKEISSQATVNGLATALENLTFMDVLNKDKFTFDEKSQINTEYKTYDGLVIKASAEKKDDKWYAKFTTAYDEATVKAEEEKAKAEEKAKEEAEKAKETKDAKDNKDNKQTQPPAAAAAAKPAGPDVKKEASDLAANLANWVYVIPDYKAQYMTKKIDDLVKAPPAKAKPEKVSKKKK